MRPNIAGRGVRPSWRFVVGVVICASAAVGCGAGGGRASTRASPTAADRPPQSNGPRVSADDVRAFRDAAAEAPYWATVDWTPPTSLERMSWSAESVVVGTITPATVDQVPWNVAPYSGAPTVYQLSVRLTVTVDRVAGGALDEPTTEVLIPVMAGPREYLDAQAGPVAARIESLAPVGATVAAVVRPSQGTVATLVAVEAPDGTTLGYYSSMDRAVQGRTADNVADALAAS